MINGELKMLSAPDCHTHYDRDGYDAGGDEGVGSADAEFFTFGDRVDMRNRIYIVEDNPIVRDMLNQFLSRVCDLDISGSARTAEQALAEIEASGADIVLIDVALPSMSGIDLVHELSARMPGLPCLMVSGHQETTYFDRAIAAGAQGYVVKGNPDDLQEGVNNVLAGQNYVSPSLRRRMSPLPHQGQAAE